jgi:hypothetical protein
MDMPLISPAGIVMIRLGLRLLGLVLLAGAFAALIIDGTRSIAGGKLEFTSFGELLLWVVPKQLETLKTQIDHANHYLWDPVALRLLALPTWSIAGFIGFLLIAIAQKKAPQIGYSSRD